MKFFVMKSVNCFGKKDVQEGKCIFAASTESLVSQCNLFIQLFIHYNRFPSCD